MDQPLLWDHLEFAATLFLILMGKVLYSEPELTIYLYNQTSVGTTLILVTIAVAKSAHTQCCSFSFL